MKVLAGIVAPDAGTVTVDGAPWAPRGPADARSRGLAMVHQELAVCPHLDVAANVALGIEPTRFGFVDARRTASLVGDALARAFGDRAIDPRIAEAFWGVMEFEGGALGVVETVWLLPKIAGIMLDDAFQVIGSNGIGNVNLLPGALTFWRDDGAEVPDVSYDPRVRGAAYGALRDELNYFCDCVRENRPPEIITAGEAVNAVRVALALAQSASENRDIDIKDWS
jgi:ABC-type sugar transport system ATPase subunit